MSAPRSAQTPCRTINRDSDNRGKPRKALVMSSFLGPPPFLEVVPTQERWSHLRSGALHTCSRPQAGSLGFQQEGAKAEGSPEEGCKSGLITRCSGTRKDNKGAERDTHGPLSLPEHLDPQ